MRFKPTFAVLSAVAAGSALFVTGGANAAQPASATGGGQVFLTTEAEEAARAGNTIAFTARDIDDDQGKLGRGQLQYVNRSEGTGRAQDVRHGEVTCIEVSGNMAYIGGMWRDGDTFDLYVEDNGNGSGTDVVTLDEGGNGTCDFEHDEAEDIFLARGNTQVRPGA